MEHLLKTSHLELERTHTLVEVYRLSGCKEVFFAMFGHNFKNELEKYAHKKEEILMLYTSLYSHITKESKESQVSKSHIDDITQDITSITSSMQECSKLLSTLISHSLRQEHIVHHEKVFFAKLLEAFHSDLVLWTSSQEEKIFGDVSKLTDVSEKNQLQHGKEVLLLQKERLEKHIKNISHNTI